MIIIQSLIYHHLPALVLAFFKLKYHIRASRKAQSAVNTSLLDKKRNIALSGWRQIRNDRTAKTWIDTANRHIVVAPFLWFGVLSFPGTTTAVLQSSNFLKSPSHAFQIIPEGIRILFPKRIGNNLLTGPYIFQSHNTQCCTKHDHIDSGMCLHGNTLRFQSVTNACFTTVYLLLSGFQCNNNRRFIIATLPHTFIF